VRAIRTTCVIVGALVVSTFGVIIPALAGHTLLCGDVSVVFARGSGQDLSEREAPVFFDGVVNRLGFDVRVTRYELGTEVHGGARYPAVGGWRDMLEAEASWTGFLGGQYGASVDAGVTELTSYLTERADACPGEIFVVGGYSQGAQVVGEALFELNSATRDRIAFVALFSDPKLYLPEGRGPFAPACRGEESPWRRGTVSCWTDSGILEARNPYLPDDVQDRTGSWCDRNDGVCDGNPADWALYDDHAEYADRGAEIDDAAREIAGALDDL
jgi:Cutinase